MNRISKAGSGINISNYPLILKLFTFWFRPLFVDAPGAMGLVVSFENMLYVALTAKLFQKGFIKFLRKGSALLKTSAVTFLATSFALSNTMSNMGEYDTYLRGTQEQKTVKHADKILQ